jgi:DNA-binding beta-propeller fold protein YncE
MRALALIAMSACGAPDGVPVALPSGGAGIGFDDLRYSPSLGRVVAPAGRAGTVALIDPDTLAVGTIGGFSATASYDGGHDFGATSVDEGNGLLFVTDRTSQKLSAVDPTAGSVLGSVVLASSPDYVRYVARTGELWVTEPSSSQIEVFAAASLRPVATIPVDNGPESLVVDGRAGRAYTHRWQARTVVLDVATRTPIAEWPNGCAASRGLAVDEQRGFFFAACLEGTVSVLDTTHDGRVLSTIARGAGYDVVGYNATLGHLYLAGTVCACLVVLGVSSSGELSFLGRFDATGSAHCAAADDRGQAWVCDPDGGRLLRIADPYPASW